MTDLDVADVDSAAMRRDRVFRRLIVQEVLLYDSDFLVNAEIARLWGMSLQLTEEATLKGPTLPRKETNTHAT